MSGAVDSSYHDTVWLKKSIDISSVNVTDAVEAVMIKTTTYDATVLLPQISFLAPGSIVLVKGGV